MAGISLTSTTASTVNELMSNAAFSTTVNGKTYSGQVTYSDGEYVASASGVSGAEATGSSAQDAENNLSVRIDQVV
ncbi:hypothetical protein [Terracidiphilus gabretensis]|jgi:hypothetical protein|uniref:hypothetical protein n=1 Tax=Terracidiphilus gabretensis TaxID=1577687 RepID=UPI00071B94BE|nr:hypothetical protein [Terracidiphilus gabretensis]